RLSLRGRSTAEEGRHLGNYVNRAPGNYAVVDNRTREGSVTVPRGHVETLPDGTQVKLGVFLSNTKSRRAKLTTDKLTALANLGLDWAAAA
ncbi:hypothetical protein ACFY1B_45825, partial [Streptomyces mirabilis]|uniref:hypothetical protein n=1 Tax=Streptomyces mirabilis TaxID=68239 RepID=UPI003687B431